MKDRHLFFDVIANRAIPLLQGVKAITLVGLSITYHSDRTWTATVNLVFFVVVVGWVDRQ